MVGQVIESLTSVLLTHREELASAEFCKESAAWRLSDELFLISLLGAACGDKDRRCRLKWSCFEAFRSNEMDAASYIQNNWRTHRNARSKIAPSSLLLDKAKSDYKETPCLQARRIEVAPKIQEDKPAPTSNLIEVVPKVQEDKPAAASTFIEVVPKVQEEKPKPKGTSGEVALKVQEDQPAPTSTLIAVAPKVQEDKPEPKGTLIEVKPKVKEDKPAPTGAIIEVSPKVQEDKPAPIGPTIASPSISTDKSCTTPRKAKTPSATAALVGALGRRVPRAPKLPTDPSCQTPASPGLSARARDAPHPQAALDEMDDSSLTKEIVPIDRTPSSPSKPRCAPELGPAISSPPLVPVRKTDAYQLPSSEEPISLFVAEDLPSPSPLSKDDRANKEVASRQSALEASCTPRSVNRIHEKSDVPQNTSEPTLSRSASTSSQQMSPPQPMPPSPPIAKPRVPKARPPPILTGDCNDSAFVASSGTSTKSQVKSQNIASMPTATPEKVAVVAKSSAVDSNAKKASAPQKCSSTPSSSGGHPSVSDSPKGDSTPRCQGVRGDNPYRRKWNPRLAAAHRRELENAKREKEESKLNSETIHGPSLGDCLSSEAEAVAEAEARSAIVEAAEEEARAAALAEYAAQTNLEDQRVTRQQDSAVSVNLMSRQVFPADIETGDVSGNSMSNPDFGTARSGMSLAAPTDRGPEHKPTGRQALPPSLDGERSVLPSPRSCPTTFHPEKPRQCRADVQSPSPRSQRTFSFCDSPVISDAVDSHCFAHAGTPRGNECSNVRKDRSVSPGRSRLTEPHRQPSEPEAPRRAMAEIRAAAERRAYAKNNAAEENNPDLVPAASDDGIDTAFSSVVESRRNMSAIRAIADRRAGGLRSSATTPRGATRALLNYDMENGQGHDEFSHSQVNGVLMNSAEVVSQVPQSQPRTPKEGGETPRCGGAYKPSRVYGSRAKEGVGRPDSLGLKFGQPPPLR